MCSLPGSWPARLWRCSERPAGYSFFCPRRSNRGRGWSSSAWWKCSSHFHQFLVTKTDTRSLYTHTRCSGENSDIILKYYSKILNIYIHFSVVSSVITSQTLTVFLLKTRTFQSNGYIWVTEGTCVSHSYISTCLYWPSLVATGCMDSNISLLVHDSLWWERADDGI